MAYPDMDDVKNLIHRRVELWRREKRDLLNKGLPAHASEVQRLDSKLMELEDLAMILRIGQ